jgi:hypothetical protein
VVPPDGWKARSEGYDNIEVMVKDPIEQNVNGSNGFYELIYLVKKTMRLSKLKHLLSRFDSISDAKTDEETNRLVSSQ